MIGQPRPEFWRGKRVFVTGHTGFKGSWLVCCLRELGAEVSGYALDPQLNSLFNRIGGSSEFAHDFRGDIRDAANLRHALRLADPEIIFHLAAQALVLDGYERPVETFDVNVMGTVYLLQAARELPSLRALVNITTDKVYENLEDGRSFSEGDRLGGRDPYSASKACSELAMAAMRASFFPRTGIVSVRAGNVIGGGDEATNRLVPDALRAFAKGEAVSVRHPSSVRPWQHVLEPLRGYLVAAEFVSRAEKSSMAYNFGPLDRDALSVGELLDHLVTAWGAGAAWRDASGGAARHEAGQLRLDISLAETELGWRPRIDLREALQLTVEWTRAAHDQASARAVTIAQIQKSLGVLA